MKKTIQKLGPLEIDIMGVVTEQQAMTVQEVQETLQLKQKKTLAYTTVMTVLTRLANKGLLQREKQGRQYVYTHTDNSTAVGESMLQKVSRNLFGGKRLAPILNLIDYADDLSAEDLSELKALIDKKIKQAKQHND